jgi:hypothetical protein
MQVIQLPPGQPLASAELQLGHAVALSIIVVGGGSVWCSLCVVLFPELAEQRSPSFMHAPGVDRRHRTTRHVT